MRIARIIRPALAGAALLVGSLGAGLLAPSVAQAQGTDARVRVAHFSSDAPPVDVYVDGKPKLRNVPFQAMSDYLTLAAGAHTFDVRAAGAAATAAPAVTVNQEFAAGKTYTVAVIGPLASVQGKAFEDNLAVPGAGKARIRVIHSTPSAPSVDVAVKGGAILFPKLAFGTASEYAEVPAGSYEIEVRDAGKPVALLTKPVTLQSGGVYTVAAVPAANGAPNLRGFIDVAPSAAPATAEQTPASSLAPSTTAPAAGSATTAAAAVTTTAAPASTKATETTNAKVTETTAAPASTKAPVTTKAPAVAETSAASDTEVADTTADTEATDTSAADTEAAAGSTETTKPAPAGGVDTGFGGLTNEKGSPTPFAALVAIAAAAIGGGLLRRRRSQG